MLRTYLSFVMLITVFLFLNSCADNTKSAKGLLNSIEVSSAPVIDGVSSDSQWKNAPEIKTYDPKAKSNITLKSVHTKSEIFFLATYEDNTEDTKHKMLLWNAETNSYKMGPSREDTFVLKWAMDQSVNDLTLSSDRPYEADIWFWKADRTNPVGYADDKMHKLTITESAESRKLKSKSGQIIYLTRPGDSGKSSYSDVIYTEFQGDKVPKTINRTPQGSRADIKAKGVWKNQLWTIEFSRKLNTGNNDDISFDLSKTYKFGVSKFEVAGREPEEGTDQPLFGTGDITEMLTLSFR